MLKVSMTSLGCAKNLIDSELMLGQLKSAGYEPVNDPLQADLILVNTCGFIGPAKKESIETILAMAEVKKQTGCRLIVAGCLTERYRSDLERDLPEVDGFLSLREIYQIDQLCRRLGMNPPREVDPAFYTQPYLFRYMTTPPHLAYLRISDGCDNRCSYCAIPSIRGKFRSRSIGGILTEARRLVDQGVKELMLIAQDLNRYGSDQSPETNIETLLKELCKIDQLPRIRIFYTHPAHYSEGFIEIIASEKKICNYLDIPLQHINDDMLRLMRRKTTAKSQKQLLWRLREQIPGIVIRTTMLVGMPGEKRRYFNELIRFMEEFQFDKLGAFAYSPEEGTPAYSFPNPVSERAKNRRLDELMATQQAISYEVHKRLRGERLSVLIDEYSEEEARWVGRSYRDAYEIDGLVKITLSCKPDMRPLRAGEFVDVRITDSDAYDLTGELVA